MGNIKYSSNLFLGAAELNRSKYFLDDKGWRQYALRNVKKDGILRASSDTQFSNFRVSGGTSPETIKVEPGLGMAGDNYVELRETLDNISVPEGSWYWVRVRQAFSSLETGTVSIDVNGNLTGVGTSFLTTLRGEPNIPSKIKFNTGANTQEYTVVRVLSNTSAILSGTFTAETGRKFSVVGTFTPGHVPSAQDKNIFQYDNSLIELAAETIVNTPPSTLASNYFYIARVSNILGIIKVQDKRSNYLYERISDTSIPVDQLLKSPIAGVQAVKFDTKGTTRDLNEIIIGWSCQSDSYSVNSNDRSVTMSNIYGGDIVNVEISIGTTTSFAGWRLYNSKGKYLIISSTIVVGNQLTIVVPGIDPLDFPGTDTIRITPDVDSIELKAKYDNGLIEVVQSFPINSATGNLKVPIPDGISQSYIVQYRYIRDGKYSPWTSFKNSKKGYYEESSFQDNGELKPLVSDHVITNYLGSDTVPYITVTASTDSYNNTIDTVYKGDRIGVRVRSLSNDTPVVSLQVGVDEWIQVFEGAITMANNFVINLMTSSAISGNYFRIIFNNNVTSGVYTLTINDNYISGGSPGTVLYSMSKTDWSYSKQPNRQTVLDFHHDGSDWKVAVIERDPNTIGDIKMLASLPVASFDIDGLGTVDETLGWQLCNGKNGSIDLRDRFVVGYDDRATDPANGIWSADYNTPQSIGGHKKINLLTTQLPSHSHGIEDDGEHSHNLRYGTGGSGSGMKDATWDSDIAGKIVAAGNHNHGGQTGSTGSGADIDIRPPYYVMVFVQRVGA